jgi:hypothetical protein
MIFALRRPKRIAWFLLIHLVFFSVIFNVNYSTYAAPPGGAATQEHEQNIIYSELLKLAQKRTTMQGAPADDPMRARHIAELRELYHRAKAIDDVEMRIAVHTELRRFGIAIPKEISLRINDDETVTPKVLVEPTTHVIYYLESDGRHVTAMAADGSILWHRDPFNDAALRPYRVSKPVVVYFAFSTREPKTPAIAINFNSSQFGIMDCATGNFHFSGQD